MSPAPPGYLAHSRCSTNVCWPSSGGSVEECGPVTQEARAQARPGPPTHTHSRHKSCFDLRELSRLKKGPQASTGCPPPCGGGEGPERETWQKEGVPGGESALPGAAGSRCVSPRAHSSEARPASRTRSQEGWGPLWVGFRVGRAGGGGGSGDGVEGRGGRRGPGCGFFTEQVRVWQRVL